MTNIKNELIEKAFKLNFKSYFGLMLAVNSECYHLWLADLQKWLRDNYNIDIVISPERYSDGVNYLVQAQKFNLNNFELSDDNFIEDASFWYNDDGDYPNYEDALEKGLLEGLKLIKDE